MYDGLHVKNLKPYLQNPTTEAVTTAPDNWDEVYEETVDPGPSELTGKTTPVDAENLARDVLSSRAGQRFVLRSEGYSGEK
ncbi:hypothetical protein DL770_004299 [Monosporascus sp. CRB-9-2]|nr:hypothetical protein DL770_004299 [Monosporascus sp. CRB-9-2]